ncbi:MAG: iron ABC transporter permease [Dehalococcoidales bacterium]|nr:iron ABC transporter permease [Dehalococcoidales bacterium]
MATAAKLKSNSGKSAFSCLRRINGLPAVTILLMILVGLFLISFALGRYPVSPPDVIKVLIYQFAVLIYNITPDFARDAASQVLPLAHTYPDIWDTIVMQIRLPRILAAMLIGASLALAGTSFQGLFRNPLVSPDILGVSQGAGFGAALAILISGNWIAIEISAFCFALLAVGVSFFVSRIVKGNPTLSLILAGMAIGSLFGAFLALMKYAADPIDQLPAITYWLMGSLASIKNQDLLFAAIPMLTGITILILIRWRFNVLAMGEEEAQALGVDTGKLRTIIVLCCTMITASAVCISGTIGWVGLVIPHIGRLLVGPNHKRLIPVCLLLGAAYLLLIDDIARLVASVEIPIGILTAIIGAPFFIYLLKRGGKGWA